MTISGYIFDNAAEQPTAQRFASLETLYDPRTIRFLTATGVGPGWRCLEVGGGSGSIATWLADRIGDTGQVLVTDIDPRFLATLAEADRSNVEVRRHDVGADPLPETDRAFAIADPANAAVARAAFKALGQLLVTRGAEREWGRNLYRRFVALGLEEVGMEGHLVVRSGGSTGARLDRANFTQIHEAAVSAGLIAAEEIDRMFALLDDPTFFCASPTMFTAWGRRP